ncbi:MAG: S8 family serine peptidase [Geobacter sp.]|nr:S8 family serine peptidase [Geobacter sp.]
MQKRTASELSLKFVVFSLVLLFSALAGKSWAGSEGPKFVADELLVQVMAGVPETRLAGILAETGATAAGEIPQLNVRIIKVRPEVMDKVKAALERNPLIKFVENNYLAEGSSTPNDPLYPSQWHLPKISSPQGWDISTGSGVVDIAIIDSGIDPSHPDLAAKLVPGYNFVGGNTDTHDVLGHGTAVAGTAAAMGGNSLGVTGLAWQNPIMPLVVLDSSNYATYSNIAQAITYAADHGVRVINISIGGSSSSSTLQNAVNYAWNKGAIIFASAMNNSTSTPYYPAACTNVVAVAATDSNDAKASFSNYGSWIDISAPGVSIYTTNNGGAYGTWNGTSFSSPLTAGLAGLILSLNPVLTNQQVVDIITANADDLGAAGFDQYFGNGRINVYKSLAAVSGAVPQSDTTAPSVAIASPAGGASVSGAVTVSVNATDNVGVARVELYVNGAFLTTDSSSPYSFYWDTAGYPDGSCTLEARAYDAAGNVGQSSLVSVKVANAKDTVAPAVSITSPADGSSIAGLKRLTVNVAASDNTGVTRIDLYVDGALKTTSSSATLSWAWNLRTVATGQHSILAKAYDAAGNAATTSITVYR